MDWTTVALFSSVATFVAASAATFSSRTPTEAAREAMAREAPSLP